MSFPWPCFHGKTQQLFVYFTLHTPSSFIVLEDVENFTINKVWRKNDNFWIYGLINTFAMLTHPNFAPVSNQNWIKIHDKITIEIKKENMQNILLKNFYV